MRRVGIQPHLLDVHQKERDLVNGLLVVAGGGVAFMLLNYIIFVLLPSSPCSKLLAKLSSLL